MPYIDSKGKIIDKRSPFRLSIITDFFWAVLNIIGLFFEGLFHPTRAIKKKDRSKRIETRRITGSNGPKPDREDNIKTLPKKDDCKT